MAKKPAPPSVPTQVIYCGDNLDQLLKLRGAADSGGQAKAMVQAGEVKVNGEVDTRRGRKLQVGDVVEARGRKLTVDASLIASGPAED